MSLSFEEQIQHASVLLQASEMDKSIENYQEALKLATNARQKVHLYSVLGRLYQKMKDPKGALVAFEQALKLYDNPTHKDNLLEKASLLNNLATVYAEIDTAKSIENYKAASDIFSSIIDSGQTEVVPHLANTQFALAEAYYKKSDFYFAKKHYKEAIRFYERLSNEIYYPLKASAHYQLGNIHTEEFNLFDAKVHYTKALSLFEILASEDESFKPYLAAVLNNLGVTFKSMEEPEKALEHYNKAWREYQGLAQRSLELFQPYVAATLNSMGIVHAEMDNFEKAIGQIREAVTLYNELADSRPQEYTHYLATGLHNLGLFHFEMRKIDLAKDYLEEALKIRRRLAEEQPKNFDPDFCATAMNLVELYQVELESRLDFDSKTKALELLCDVAMRLQGHEDNRPALKNMISDCQHYLAYFNSIDEEHLSLQLVFRKINGLKEEIDGTIEPTEKIVFQQEIMELLSAKSKEYPHNDRLREALVYAHVNLSWLHLRIGDFIKAEKIVVSAPKLKNPGLSLQCNLAHSYLLQDNLEEATRLYKMLWEQTDSENEKYRDVILKDFEILKNDGIQHSGFEAVKQMFP